MNVLNENWDTSINLDELENKAVKYFETNVTNICKQLLCVLNEYVFKRQPNFLENKNFSYEEHLKKTIESNKNLKQEIDEKLREVTQQQSQYKMFKEDQKLLTKEIKETHEAFLMAKKNYKRFLKLYYTIQSKDLETQVVFVQFFTESKKDSESYSIQLKRNPNNGKYLLQDMNPKLNLFQDAQQILQETNDVPGVLCFIRDGFKTARESKKLKIIN